MCGRQIRPAGVIRAVAQELSHEIMPGHRVAEPPWFRIMNRVPPAETLVRTTPPSHQAPNRRAKKPKNLYRPQRITFPEDELRAVFYKDHPWELARPRVIVELDGKDYQYCDWSKGLRQPGMPLSGESVVQRQLWLMEKENMNKQQAYDTARREFYRLRQAEEIERRVAVEEARWVGAYFGLSKLDVGMMLEDREFENWKKWAGKMTADREARRSAQTETFGMEEKEVEKGVEEGVEEGVERMEEEVEGAAPADEPGEIQTQGKAG